MFVTVDFLIKLTCSFPDKSELLSLNKKLKLSRHNPHYHHRFAEAIALRFLQPQKRRVSMHDFRSGMPKTHFRLDLQKKTSTLSSLPILRLYKRNILPLVPDHGNTDSGVWTEKVLVLIPTLLHSLQCLVTWHRSRRNDLTHLQSEEASSG